MANVTKKRGKGKQPDPEPSAVPGLDSNVSALIEAITQQHPKTLTQVMAQQQAQQQAAMDRMLDTFARLIPQAGDEGSQFGGKSPHSSFPPWRPVSSRPPVGKMIDILKLAGPETMHLTVFRDWHQRWKDYNSAQRLEDCLLETQHGILHSSLDKEWTVLCTASRLGILAKDKVETVISRMEGYLRQKSVRNYDAMFLAVCRCVCARMMK